MSNSRLPCEDCGSSDALKDYGDHTFCFSCLRRRFKKGYSSAARCSKSLWDTPAMDFPKEGPCLPPFMTSAFSEAELLWLATCGITKEMQDTYELGVIPEYNNKQRIVIPVYNRNKELTGYQARSLEPGDPRKYITKGQLGLFWTRKPSEKPWITLTEDALSAIRIEGAQAASKVVQSAALLGLRLKKDDLLTMVKEYSIILIWLDSDDRGQKAAKALAKKFRLYGRAVYIQEFTDKEPKQCHNAEIREILQKYFPI